jgi:hypothetical protein
MRGRVVSDIQTRAEGEIIKFRLRFTDAPYMQYMVFNIMVFKARNQLVPEYICGLFQLKSSVTNRVTRSSADNDLWVPRNKLAIRRKALPYSGATLYNSLPLEIRNSSSVASFKIRTYQYFLETV